MGNINSNDLHSHDPNLLLLVRYWSSVIETTDNLSTISKRKIKRSKDAAAPKRKKVTRNSSVIAKNGRRLTRNGSVISVSDSVTSRKSYLKRKTLPEDFLKTITENLEDFDWKTKTYEEIEKMKEIVQRKELNRMENDELTNKPEEKKLFRRKKKTSEDETSLSEMWTLTEKSTSPDYTSINVNKDVDYDSINQTSPEKMFWKTSKLSIQDTKIFQAETNSNPNMLWRSSKDIKKFCEDNFVEITGIFENCVNKLENDYESVKNTEVNVKQIGNLNTLHRKARLSRWAFLRHREEAKNGGKRNVKHSFRVPQRRYSRKYRSEVALRKKVTKKWGLFKNVKNNADTKNDNSDYDSCDCSCCSCDGCQQNGNSKLDWMSITSSEEGEMAPNSEENLRITVQNRKSWGSDISDKEPQRPPVYNPEDYALSLKKWGRKANTGMQMPLYASQSTGSIDRISVELTKSMNNKRQSSPSTKSSSSSKNGDEKQTKKEKEMTLKLEKKDSKNKENINLTPKDGLNKDYRNPILTLPPQGGEMSLRQFSSVTELLGKLKVDLRLSFPSFVQEFVGDPVDGVTLLLELLRAVQLSQASQQQRCPPQVLRRALLDEHSCLVCLKHCLRCPDASRRLASSPAGLFTLAVCIMSNVTKSRIIALELLTKACESPANGHKPVSEALSTLRLRFGEPVRFRFLVGMLNSAGAVELLTVGMKFINVFLETAPNVQQKVYIQAELEQAGFDSKILRKTLPSNSESVKTELTRWDKNYFDVEILQNKLSEMESLRDKVQLLEKRIQILQEEKGILQSLEQCLKERCSELEEEVSIKTSTTTLTKSTAHIKPFRNYNTPQPDYNNYKRSTEKGESTPAEDEGISSSEQELSQDEDYIKGTLSYNNVPNNLDQIITPMEGRTEFKSYEPVKIEKPPRANLNTSNEKIINNLKNVKNKMKETNVDDGHEIIEDDEEETTIDEVIEELQNIVNDAETEAYGKLPPPEPPAKPPKTYLRNRELMTEDKTRTYTKSVYEKDVFEEAEIVPSIILPQPPRRTRSLVHIFLPGREYDDNVKNEFFDEDTDTESSDSLLTREKRAVHNNCHHRSLDVSDSYNSFSSVNTRTLFIKDYDDAGGEGKYEERNIDEEEIKRRHLKKTNEQDRYEKTTSFQGIKSCITPGNVTNESPFVRRTQRFIPVPVKRSQTFHMAPPDGNRLRTEIKPKPKMGVSGLDLHQRQGKYQNVDYKKNTNDRYLKKKNEKTNGSKNQSLLRRGSFDGLFFVTEPVKPKKPEQNSDQKNLRSKSLEKMDDGLDSLVDIVISPEQNKKPKKSEWNLDISKNIGPRTRRSLAESSLFSQPPINNLNKEVKPPQPAQRTSLTRNNSSSTPLHLPVEIKVAPIQPRSFYNFGIKSSKSEDSLLSGSSPPKRYPPDGSSSPMDFPNNGNESNSPIYATPVKQSKLQKFFGNPKFDGTDNGPNSKYFESNYACSPNDKKSISPMPRNIQNIASSTTQMVKNLISKEVKEPGQKLNFFLGTYQSQPVKSNVSSKNSEANSASSPNSLNSFNNSFLIKRGNVNAGLYSGNRDNSNSNQGYKSPTPFEQAQRHTNNQHSGIISATKVTDSPSGLY